jgi:hypothetical protein
MKKVKTGRGAKGKEEVYGNPYNYKPSSLGAPINKDYGVEPKHESYGMDTGRVDRDRGGFGREGR